jgi:hypothetical protein
LNILTFWRMLVVLFFFFVGNGKIGNDIWSYIGNCFFFDYFVTGILGLFYLWLWLLLIFVFTFTWFHLLIILSFFLVINVLFWFIMLFLFRWFLWIRRATYCLFNFVLLLWRTFWFLFQCHFFIRWLWILVIFFHLVIGVITFLCFRSLDVFKRGWFLMVLIDRFFVLLIL